MPSYTDQMRADIQPSYSDSLYHFGIKGMKWGVRRFRNYDGTLTNAGKAQAKKQNSGGSGRKGMSEQTKRRLKTAAKVAAGVAGTAALAGGAYYLAKSGKGRQAYDAARSAARGLSATARDNAGRVANRARSKANSTLIGLGATARSARTAADTARVRARLGINAAKNSRAAQAIKNSRVGRAAGVAAYNTRSAAKTARDFAGITGDIARTRARTAVNSARSTARGLSATARDNAGRVADRARSKANSTLIGLGATARSARTAADTARVRARLGINAAKNSRAAQAVKNSRVGRAAGVASYHTRSAAKTARDFAGITGDIARTRARTAVNSARSTARGLSATARDNAGRVANRARSKAASTLIGVGATARSARTAADTARVRARLARNTARDYIRDRRRR